MKLTEEMAAMFRAAKRYLRLQPWELFDDGYNVGVRVGVEGEVHYLSVLGAAGLVTGLALYPGGAGYQQLLDDREGMDPTRQDAEREGLLLWGADRGELSAQGRRLLKEAGVRCRGRGNWPLLLEMRPGWAPRLPEGKEAAVLATALNLVCGLVEEYNRTGELPNDVDEEGRVLTWTLDEVEPAQGARDSGRRLRGTASCHQPPGPEAILFRMEQ